MDIEQIIKLILTELDRAEKIHPRWPEDIVHQAAIIGEEAGEVIKAALNHVYFNDDKDNIKKEAIQTAAMVIRFLKNNNS